MVQESLGDVPAGLWGLIGTVLGGYGVHVGQKRLKAMDTASLEKRDHRSEIDKLTKRLDDLEREVTFWRRRFYEEQVENAKLRIALIQHGIQPPVPLVYPLDREVLDPSDGLDGPSAPPVAP